MHHTHTDYLFDRSHEAEHRLKTEYLNKATRALPQSLRHLLDRCYYQRFEQKKPTAQLLQNAQSEAERRVISIVAMLDLDKTTLFEVITPAEWQFIGSCHAYLRQREQN